MNDVIILTELIHFELRMENCEKRTQTSYICLQKIRIYKTLMMIEFFSSEHSCTTQTQNKELDKH